MSHSLLKLQIGPVQDFIAQARSTRDLWSGSYLLSWLIAHAIRGLLSAPGDVRVVYPALAASDEPGRLEQPLVRYLRQGERTNGLSSEAIRTSNLPNVLLALVPGDWTDREVNEHAVGPLQAQWQEEIEACLSHYEGSVPFSGEEASLFRVQADRFWEITWQLWLAKGPDEVLPLLGRLPGGDELCHRIKAAIANDPAHREDHLWPACFRLASHRLEARRQTRNFDAWPETPLARRQKDALSGREEAIADHDWLARARVHGELRYRFRHGDELGAPTLIKRIWDAAFLKPRHPEVMEGRSPAFDSVPAVAAAPWLAKLRERLRDGRAEQAFWDFVANAYAATAHLPSEVLPRGDLRLEQWLDRVDAQIFHETCWDQWQREAVKDGLPKEDASRLFNPPQVALQALCQTARLGKPGRYYAVLALDGDQMGHWLLGAKHPPGAAFTQAWHEQFSRALATFSLDRVQRLVNSALGQLIYAGGDDVLVLLPAETAIRCATELARSFRDVVGQAAPGVTASVGLAIGHMKEPLQDMVRAAQAAERHAKDGLGRNALALTLIKRSGELIKWGCPFTGNDPTTSAALKLLHFFQGEDTQGNPRARRKLDDPDYQPLISGKFPHRLAELLERYQTFAVYPNGLPDFSRPLPLTRPLRDIAEREVQRAIRRQCDKLPEADQTRLFELSSACLAELEPRHAPLQDFHHLFAVEAFIARQGD